VALTDRRLIFMDASFWTSRPKGLAWSDPRDSITISDLQTDNKLWNWGKISSPTKQNLRMNFHPFWRPEPKAMGEWLAARIVVPRLAPGAAGDPDSSAPAPPRPPAAPPPLPPSEGLSGRRGTLCYPGAVPGGVAQSGRALPSHGRGPGFKSPHLHFQPLIRTRARE